MAKQQKRLIAGLVAGIVVVALVAGGAAIVSRSSTAGPDATDNVRVVEDHKLPERWAINAAYGRGALSNLRAALGEIDKENAEEARKGVAVAQSLLGKIASGASGDVRERDSVADYILVHSEVRVLGDGDPENTVQAKLDSLRSEIDMSDHEAIIAALDSLDVPLAYTRIDLPLSETRALVHQALEALETRDSELARIKLLQIGDGLRVDTVRVGAEQHRVESGDEKDAS
jgi:hypothetical protein